MKKGLREDFLDKDEMEILELRIELRIVTLQKSCIANYAIRALVWWLGIKVSNLC